MDVNYGSEYRSNGQNVEQQLYNDVVNFDYKEVLKRLFKYFLEGLAVALVAYYFTRGRLDGKEILVLGITAAFVFAILDTFAPSVSYGVRFGAGFGIGQSVFGLGPVMSAPLAAI